jgi:hypothetical protein
METVGSISHASHPDVSTGMTNNCWNGPIIASPGYVFDCTTWPYYVQMPVYSKKWSRASLVNLITNGDRLAPCLSCIH